MLQLTYISTPRGKVSPDDLTDILRISRRNNRRDDVTGLLFFDGHRFLQALEGPEDRVTAAFARIKADPRHFAVVTLSKREVDTREFGEWEMASRGPGETADALVGRLSALAANASPAVRATFDGFAQVKRA
jgi:hypothetical protein